MRTRLTIGVALVVIAFPATRPRISNPTHGSQAYQAGHRDVRDGGRAFNFFDFQEVP